MRPSFLLVISFVAARALASDPFLAPETLIASAPSSTTYAYESQHVAAAGPDGFFAAWSESAGNQARLIGLRLSASGHPAGKAMLLGMHPISDPRVMWDGSHYVVSAELYEGSKRVMKAWRITADGVLAGPTSPPPLARNAAGESIEVTVESGIVVVRFIDDDGTKHPVSMPTIEPSLQVIAAAPVAKEWVIIARDYSKHYWIRLNRIGVVARRTVMTNPSWPVTRTTSSFATNGMSFDAVFTDVDTKDLGTPKQQYVRTTSRFSIWAADGIPHESVIESETIWVRHASEASNLAGIQAASFDGRQFVFAWTWMNMYGDHELRIMRGNARPRAVYRSKEALSVHYDPVLASGERGLVLWRIGQPNGGSDLAAASFDDAATVAEVAEPILITRNVRTQLSPLAAATENGILVAWYEVDRITTIHARFVPWSGVPGAPFTLSTPGSSSGSLTVVSNDDTILVAWTEAGSPVVSLKMRRFDRNGNAIDPEPLLVARVQTGGLTGVPDGDGFVLSYINYANRVAYAARIPSGGAISWSPVKIMGDDDGFALRTGPALARADGHIVALFTLERDNVLRVAGVRLSDTLQPELKRVMWFQLWNTWYRSITSVISVAAGANGELLVAWSMAAHNEPVCLRVRTFDRNLWPLGAVSTVACARGVGDGKVYLPALAWDGERWWLSFAEQLGSPLRLWPIAAAGTLQEPLVLAEPENEARSVSLLRTPHGVLSLYARTVDTPQWLQRAFMRQLILQPPRGRAVRH